MFGDIGHGTLLFLFGSILVIFGENIVKSTLYKNRSEDLECKDIKFMYKARYMFLFMGMFAAYCGFIYNDCFSLSLNYS